MSGTGSAGVEPGAEVAVRQGGGEVGAHGGGEGLGGMLLALNPAEVRAVIDHGALVAREFVDTIRRAGLVTEIRKGGKVSEHVQEAGWGLLGTLVGVTVHVSEPEAVDYRGAGRSGWAFGWRAEAVVTDRAGRELARDWGLCLRTEDRWQTAADYAVLGMASTRASRRAQSRALGWIVRLAGLDPTPPEEMEDHGGQRADAPPADKPPADKPRQRRTRPPAAPKPDPVDDDPGRDGPPPDEPAPSSGDEEGTYQEPEPPTDAPTGPGNGHAGAPQEGTGPPPPVVEPTPEGRVRAAQVEGMARRRSMAPPQLRQALVDLAVLEPEFLEAPEGWQLQAALAFSASEDRYLAALEVASRWTAPTPEADG